MLLDVFSILWITLAVWEVLDLLLRGSLFSRWRAFWEVREGLVAELFTCGFCLAPWVSLAAVGGLAWLSWHLITNPDQGHWWPLAWVPIQGLAVAKLVTFAGQYDPHSLLDLPVGTASKPSGEPNDGPPAG